MRRAGVEKTLFPFPCARWILRALAYRLDFRHSLASGLLPALFLTQKSLSLHPELRFRMWHKCFLTMVTFLQCFVVVSRGTVRDCADRNDFWRVTKMDRSGWENPGRGFTESRLPQFNAQENRNQVITQLYLQFNDQFAFLLQDVTRMHLWFQPRSQGLSSYPLCTNVSLKSFFFAFIFTHRHEQEKSQGVSEISELRRRIKQLEEENEEMSDNRLQLIGKTTLFSAQTEGNLCIIS